VDDLARRFGVSASTVRRDLQHLSDTKAVRRTYGGAILAAPSAETTLDQRLAVNGPEKQAIARAALALITDGETLTAFGRLLLDRRLRIITNNLALLPLLARAPEIDLVVLGGSVRTTSMGTVGPLAVEALRRMTADRAVMSADGVVAGRGLCEASLDQVALKSAMIAQAQDTVVLADAGKLGRAEQRAWAPLPPRWTLVTDAAASQDQRQHLAADGASLVVADTLR
jgi:DeoR/GlpR family transcriptional regulator of sugar metabolism